MIAIARATRPAYRDRFAGKKAGAVTARAVPRLRPTSLSCRPRWRATSQKREKWRTRRYTPHDEDSVTTTEFFVYLKSFRNLEPAYQIIEHDGSDTFPDGRRASTGVTVKRGTQLLQVEGFATIRLPLSSSSMVTIPTYNRRQNDIVPAEVSRVIGNDVACCLFGDVYLRKYGQAPVLVNRVQSVRSSPGAPCGASGTKQNKAITTCQTVTLDRACRAVEVYNQGLDGHPVKEDLDIRVHKMFAGGLGSSRETIEEQLRFIGNDYGGVAGRPAALNLAPSIAHDIFQNREEYERVAYSALPILSEVADRNTIAVLYRPFVQLLVDKNGRETSNWKVWAAKFWHHLNPHAFPIRDRRVDMFFILPSSNPIDEYLELLNRFRAFVVSHQEWLPRLRQADGGVDGEVDGIPVCSGNKLWDKMCYALVDLDKAGK
jgi:hypothetical protein